ncbi:hypothetical protein GCM10027035_25940 [Emticicia sediminis]
MKTQTKTILEIIKYLALIGAIGFSIECGSQLISFIISFWNPALAQKIYLSNPLIYGLRSISETHFQVFMHLLIGIAAIKAAVWYYLFDFLHKLKLKNPFTNEVSNKIQNISYLLLSLWIIAEIGNGYCKYVSKRIDVNLVNYFNNEEYFFMAGIVYIIAQVFKRGVELQEENELTV